MSYETYDQVPSVYAKNRSLWRDLIAGARGTQRRVAMFGDSQETEISGSGGVYVPRLNYEFWRRIGYVSEAPYDCHIFNHYVGGAGGFLRAGAIQYHNNQTVPDTYLLPGCNSRNSGSTSNSSNYYNVLLFLDHDAKYVNADAGITGIETWDRTQSLYADLFAFTESSGPDELAWRFSPHTSLSYFQANTATGTTSSMSLSSSNDVCVKETVGPIAQDTEKYGQLVIRDENNDGGAQLAGGRFRLAQDRGGLTISSFSQGGYTATAMLSNRANAGGQFAAVGPWDFVILQYGANESDDGVTADSYKDNIETLIAALRGASWANDAALPVVLIADCNRTGLTSGQQDNYDQYQGALYAIAQEDDYALSINARRITNNSLPLDDSVHLTSGGQVTLAEAVADAIWSVGAFNSARLGMGLGLGM